MTALKVLFAQNCLINQIIAWRDGECRKPGTETESIKGSTKIARKKYSGNYQKNQREEITMSTTGLIILIVVLVLVFGGGGGYYWRRRR
jgi:hypothetical protein